MGMDGGIRIVKIKEVRDNWTSLKQSLIGYSEVTDNTRKWHPYDVSKFNSINDFCNRLPDTIENLSDKELMDVLKIFRNCDSPYLYEDNIIIASGDNLYVEGQVLDDAVSCLTNVFIETWT